MTGLRGEAAIVGIAELPAERRQSGPPLFTLDQYARLAKMVDRGRRRRSRLWSTACHATASPSRTCSHPPRCRSTWGCRWISVSGSTWVERPRRAWCGGPPPRSSSASATRCSPSCPDRRDDPAVGSAGPAGHSSWYGASSNNYGSPQAEFEIPYGNVGPERALRADRAALRGRVRLRRSAPWRKIAVDQRTNACAHPGAVFHGKPITVDDVLASPVIADPIHMLETVMRVQGGAGVLIANADIARRARHRPVWIKGFGEHIRVQDADLRRRSASARRSRAPPNGRSRWRGCSAPMSTWRRSTTATRSPC